MPARPQCRRRPRRAGKLAGGAGELRRQDRRARDGDGRTLGQRERDRAGRSGVRAVTFASPWFLLVLLVVPAMLAFGLWIEGRRAKYAVAFTNLDVLASVATPRRRPLRWLP